MGGSSEREARVGYSEAIYVISLKTLPKNSADFLSDVIQVWEAFGVLLTQPVPARAEDRKARPPWVPQFPLRQECARVKLPHTPVSAVFAVWLLIIQKISQYFKGK